ncbi:zinc finger and BTB domain-containing protein 8A-like [Scleropages formosus]|uniref:zinc finger and BTB domain-containing protein 8A-like n=1 Tax=Scleropages formosus TaxID=113540 RepID=UPI0010FAC0EA|nr:zinc finger and BTB domain-containing protein 8A-like [Scleropages formosus]
MEIESHYRQLLRELDEQRRQGILCDVSVVVEGRPFAAHRNVLLGSSRYFKTLYSSWTEAEPEPVPGGNPNAVTHLDIVTARAFEAILDFMYSARLVLTGANVIEVMSAASYLQMTDVVQACHAFIRATLDISLRSRLVKKLAEVDVNSSLPSSAMSGSKTSSLLAPRTDPDKSLDDSLITSSQKGSRVLRRVKQGKSSHTCQEEALMHTLWDQPTKTIGEQTSPSSPRGSQGQHHMAFLGELAQRQAAGSKRRKNRKNKDTVRHITEQVECGVGPSELSMFALLSASGLSSSNRETSGARTAADEQLLSGVRTDEGDPREEEAWSARGWEHHHLQGELSGTNGILPLHRSLLGADPTLSLEQTPSGGNVSLPLIQNIFKVTRRGDKRNRVKVLERKEKVSVPRSTEKSTISPKKGKSSALLPASIQTTPWQRFQQLRPPLPSSRHLPPPLSAPCAATDCAVGGRKFHCPCCSFSAVHQCILRRHLRSHTGERPYPCATCGKTFTRREHMKRHAQVHSKDTKFTCKVCGQMFPSAAAVGVRRGSRRHAVCSSCSGSNGQRGSPMHPEDTETAEQEEADSGWKDNSGTPAEEEPKEREERG